MNSETCDTKERVLRLLQESVPLTAGSESITWLTPKNSLPFWSRRLSSNLEGSQRYRGSNRYREFDVEIPDRVWSLWGGLHPKAPIFDKRLQGRQALGCCVVACCVASTFCHLGHWSGKLLDAIVLNGDRYYRASVEKSQQWELPLGVDDMCAQCDFQDLRYLVQMELVAFGYMYSDPASATMSLLEGFKYFFTRYQSGVLQCEDRYYAFGYSSSLDGGYFFFDCYAWGKPLFPDNMGASYVLLIKHLQGLLYCVVGTLNVRRRNVEFRIYNVDLAQLPPVTPKKQRGLR
ncbi:uncharacterized protein LOC110190228 [Drosophila serrata]|uniref:uncharacterized protein LOC110190228 n=1 Tax=Drosophila serrata TaxID=7274 RepID=UPI000A1D1BA7|nr:uncharacterized protein LOC110190228 [Drosophila serrata]